MTRAVALIGFGEAGETFARAGDWSARVFDVLPSRRAAAGAMACDSAAEALAGIPLVLSLVTADQALAAAAAGAAHLPRGALWCDGNSVAPETKRAAALAIEAAGGGYVDMAVLAPVEPARLAVPLLLSGSAADAAAQALGALGFSNVRVVGSEVGRASAIKMIRSVMVKGIEALSDEMMAAADCRRSGRRGARLARCERKDHALGAARGLQPRADGHPRLAPRRRDGRIRQDPAGAGRRAADDRAAPSSASATPAVKKDRPHDHRLPRPLHRPAKGARRLARGAEGSVQGG